MHKIRFVLLSALCGMAALQLVGSMPAAANTITIFALDGTTEAGTLTDHSSSTTLEGFTAHNTLSTMEAITSPQTTNSNPSTEATLLNSYAGTSFTGTDIVQGPSNPSNPLTITSVFFLLKLDGPNTGYALFENVSGGTLTLDYTEVGQAAGLSHVSEAPGPVVGAGLPGLIAACGALLMLARRRRQQVA